MYVYLGARDAGRGRAAVAAIEAELQCSGRIECLPLDVTSDDSVAAAAATLAKAAPLYGLVNNAGVGFGLTVPDTLAVKTK